MARSTADLLTQMITILEELRERLPETTATRKAPGKRRTTRSRGGPSPKRVLQAKYMGALRALPPRKRAHVKRVRAEKGTAAAIKLAARLRG